MATQQALPAGTLRVRLKRGLLGRGGIYEMIRLCIFAIISIFITYVSRKSLFHPRSHGFTRFFAWEFILALVLLNALHWFRSPFSPKQLVSWLFLIISIFLVAHGVRLLRVVGKPNKTGLIPRYLNLREHLP